MSSHLNEAPFCSSTCVKHPLCLHPVLVQVLHEDYQHYGRCGFGSAVAVAILTMARAVQASSLRVR